MKERLTKKLRKYIKENNPDLLVMLQEESGEEIYVNNAIMSIDPYFNQMIKENAPHYIIEETCFNALIKPLQPSKYNCIKAIAEEKFPKQYAAFERAGVLRTELINVLNVCLPLFEVFNFNEETEDDDYLRESIAIAMRGYFND